MKYLIALLALMLIATAHAQTIESQYVVVVGENAPATDVILGANFAASMKGTVGVTFSSAIDTEIYQQITDEELARKTIVVIDGEEREVRILGTSNAAAAAEIYFNRQGFATEQITQPSPEDVLVNPIEPASAEPVVPVQVTAPVEEIINETIEIIETRVDPQPILQPDLSETVEPAERAPSEQNVFSRVARWFRNLF